MLDGFASLGEGFSSLAEGFSSLFGGSRSNPDVTLKRWNKELGKRGLRPIRYPASDPKAALYSDAEALRGDWNKVGEDFSAVGAHMQKAMDEVLSRLSPEDQDKVRQALKR